jgi:hypothetical protein
MRGSQVSVSHIPDLVGITPFTPARREKAKGINNQLSFFFFQEEGPTFQKKAPSNGFPEFPKENPLSVSHF